MSIEGPKRPPNSDVIPKINTVPPFQTDIREFEGLNVLEQLRRSFSVTIKPDIDAQEKRVLCSKAIISVLKMDPKDRDDLGIHIVAIGELNELGRVQTTFPEWSCYSVYAVFPFDKKTSHFIDTGNISLQNELPENTSIDQIVNDQADDIRKETLFEKQKRLIREIKAIDTGIARRIDKSPHQGEQTQKELNSWKSIKILEYLQTSSDLQEEHPELSNFFRMEKDKTGQTKVKMRQVTDHTLRRRLEVANTVSLLEESTKEYDTGIDVDHLRKDYRKFLADPRSAPDSIKISTDICRMLGISARTDESQKTKEITIVDENSVTTSPIAVEAKAGEPTDEVLASTTDKDGQKKSGIPATVIFESSTKNTSSEPPITNAARKRMKKYPQNTPSSRSPQDTDDMTQSDSPQKQFQIVSFAELRKKYGILEPASLKDVAEIDNTDFARRKAAAAIHHILSLSPEKCQELGLQVVAIGDVASTDPLYQMQQNIHQYRVYVLFPSDTGIEVISAERGAIIRYGKNKETAVWHALDQRVLDTAEIIAETTPDRYQRLLSEITLVEDMIITQKRAADKYSYRMMGDTPGRAEQERLLREQVSNLTGIKRALLLQGLQTTEQIQTAYSLPPLFFQREGENESHVFLSFQRIEEKNIKQRLLGIASQPILEATDYLPEIGIVLKRSSKRSQASRSGQKVTIDEQLATFLRKRRIQPELAAFDKDIPEELREFAELSIRDQLIQAKEDEMHSRKGLVDKILATAEKRITMRNILRATPEERKQLGIKIMVIGPEKKGKIVIEDNVELTQYSVFIIFPSQNTNAYLTEVRHNLARNPYMKLKPPLVKYLPSRKDLLTLDAVINSVGADIRPEEEDIYMKFQHQIQAIDFVDTKIKALKDENLDLQEKRKRTLELFKTKLPFVLSFIELANILQEQHPEFRQLYELKSTNRKDTLDLVMHPIPDIKSHKYVLRKSGLTDRNIVQTGSPKSTPLFVDKLFSYKEASEIGNQESEITGAAAAICDILGLNNGGT